MIHISQAETPEDVASAIIQLAEESGWDVNKYKADIRVYHRQFILGRGEPKPEKKLKWLRDWFFELLEKAPFFISLDNLDDREGCVMIDTLCKTKAFYDQSIAGANWEIPSDMDIAYAMPSDHPGLLEELKKEGYNINDDNYSPPDEAGDEK